ncbi:hypothetical protein AVEN_84522-1 [Araneus ventricosus]|uniref:Uncharacterized protein n=1 Tax=Araneus ventricosus TaxID=182803 RepID=A0A4Y2F8L9_ARAVE|nr:hypothetical protein AVEN_84522-1 [Araneus ventricosus]
MDTPRTSTSNLNFLAPPEGVDLTPTYLTSIRLAYTVVLRWNWVTNLESSGFEAEAIPPSHRGSTTKPPIIAVVVELTWHFTRPRSILSQCLGISRTNTSNLNFLAPPARVDLTPTYLTSTRLAYTVVLR